MNEQESKIPIQHNDKSIKKPNQNRIILDKMKMKYNHLFLTEGNQYFINEFSVSLLLQLLLHNCT